MYWMATSGNGGFSPRRVPISIESAGNDLANRHAEATASDWQIILHLRTLIGRDPSIVLELLEDARQQPISYTNTIYAATREAIAEQPKQASLHYFAALGAIQLGRFREAEAALDEALDLAPQYSEAHLLAVRVALETRQTGRADERLRRAEQNGVNPQAVAELRARLNQNTSGRGASRA